MSPLLTLAHNMKLLYATSIDLPSTRANRLQVVNMARAFHKLLGDRFSLGLHAKAPEYNLRVPFVEVKRSRSIVLAMKYLRLAKRAQFTHLYCREEKLLLFILLYNMLIFRLPITFCYELHHLWHIKSWWYRILLRHVVRIISITHGMKDRLVALGLPGDKILVAPDAVDIAMFDIAMTKKEAREKLSLPSEKRIVLYTGTIHEPWKGVGTLYEAMKQLDDRHLCVIVGGKPHYVNTFSALNPPVPQAHFAGHRPHAEIPLYLRAADVVVVPNSAKSETSRIYTSPLKLFEYMASERPMVASDLPSIREVINEHDAILVTPDDPEALARGIKQIFENEPYALSLARHAREKVNHYTWDMRAKSITDFITFL